MHRWALRSRSVLNKQMSRKHGQGACILVFAGLLYLRMGTSLPMDLSDRVSGLWFSLAIIMFTPSFTALVVWDKERLLLRRESATGACCCAFHPPAARHIAGVTALSACADMRWCKWRCAFGPDANTS